MGRAVKFTTGRVRTNRSQIRARSCGQRSFTPLAFAEVQNYPPGNPSRSEADIRRTRQLSEGARILQMEMLDYVIIGQPTEEQVIGVSKRLGMLR